MIYRFANSRSILAMALPILALVNACGSGSPVEEPVPQEAKEVMGLELGELQPESLYGISNEQFEEFILPRLEHSFFVTSDPNAALDVANGPQTSSAQPFGTGYSRLVLIPNYSSSKNGKRSWAYTIFCEDPYAQYSDSDELEQRVRLNISISMAEADWLAGIADPLIDWNIQSLDLQYGLYLGGTVQASLVGKTDWEAQLPEERLPQRVLAMLQVDGSGLAMLPDGQAADGTALAELLATADPGSQGQLLEFRRNEFGGYDLQGAGLPQVQLLQSLSLLPDEQQLNGNLDQQNFAVVTLDDEALGSAWQQVQPFGEYRWPLAEGEELRLRADSLDMLASATFDLPGIVLRLNSTDQYYSSMQVPCRLVLVEDWSSAATDESASRRQIHFGGFHVEEHNLQTEQELSILLGLLSGSMAATVTDQAAAAGDQITENGNFLPAPDWGGESSLLSSQSLLQLNQSGNLARSLMLELREDGSGYITLANVYPVKFLMPDGQSAWIDNMECGINRDSWAHGLSTPLLNTELLGTTSDGSMPLHWQIEGRLGEANFNIAASQLIWIGY